MLTINAKTTGFGSPAETYVDKRLDLNELIIENIHTTFYFRYMGPDVLGVKKGNVLVIDRSQTPQDGDLVVLTDKTHFKIREYEGQENLWVRVSWILNKI